MYFQSSIKSAVVKLVAVTLKEAYQCARKGSEEEDCGPANVYARLALEMFKEERDNAMSAFDIMMRNTGSLSGQTIKTERSIDTI